MRSNRSAGEPSRNKKKKPEFRRNSGFFYFLMGAKTRSASHGSRAAALVGEPIGKKKEAGLPKQSGFFLPIGGNARAPRREAGGQSGFDVRKQPEADLQPGTFYVQRLGSVKRRLPARAAGPEGDGPSGPVGAPSSPARSAATQGAKPRQWRRQGAARSAATQPRAAAAGCEVSPYCVFPQRSCGKKRRDFVF